MGKPLLSPARSNGVLPTSCTPGEVKDRNREVRFTRVSVRLEMEETVGFVENQRNQALEDLLARLSPETIDLIVTGGEALAAVAQELGWDPTKKERQINDLINYVFGVELTKREYDPSLDL